MEDRRSSRRQAPALDLSAPATPFEPARKVRARRAEPGRADSTWGAAVMSGQPTAHSALQQKLGAPQRRDHLDPILWPSTALSELCAAALQAGVELEYVTSLIASRGLRPDGPHVLHWPWPVRIYTLGRFSLVRHGVAVSFAGKSPRKPLHLLQVLIALGGRDVHTSLLMRALWPEETERDLRKLFDNTLHRLRQILGHEDAVLLRDSKLTLDIRFCWVDAWAFDQMVGRLGDGQEAPPAAIDDAWRLYKGHFLQREAEEPWVLPYRERLRSRFHRFILSQGQRLEQGGQWEGAGRLYAQAIEIDPLAEILYRRLMVCLQNRGECAEALGVYRRCRDQLSIVLDVRPSPETEAIRRLLANR